MMGSKMAKITLERARAAKRIALERFRRFETLTGVGITRLDGQYAVKLNFSKAFPDQIPKYIDGVPLCVEITGPLRAQRR
jgi:hypothetical protein